MPLGEGNVVDLSQWASTRAGRAILVGVLPVGIFAALIGSVFRPQPARTLVSAAIPPSPTKATILASHLSATPISDPTSLPTPTLIPYQINEGLSDSTLGVSHLYIAETSILEQAPTIDPSDLRLPTPNFRPQTGRYHEIRGRFKLIHLGSDYMDPGEAVMAPPHEDALLGALVHLKRNTFMAIAIDMSGDVQMYLIRLNGQERSKAYLFCFAHLKDGSNRDALSQASANNGHVSVMGSVSTVDSTTSNLSDVHIGVIDVDALYMLTNQTNLADALQVLFAGSVPRTGQQYPSIFVEPESVYPALAANLAEHQK
jgi:hypothetical protein